MVDTLKDITEVTETIPSSDDKYKVVSPETMQEAFLSDSEDEGGRHALHVSLKMQKYSAVTISS